MAGSRSALRLRQVQKLVWDNKRRKGFNTTDVPYEFCLLQGEVAELFEAWRKKEPVGHELADVAIYLLGLAEMLGVDLELAISEKMAVNEQRRYLRIGGVLSKDLSTDQTVGAVNPSLNGYRGMANALRVVGQDDVLF